MEQWQMTPRIGGEMARYRTAPQRQPPSNSAVSVLFNFASVQRLHGTRVHVVELAKGGNLGLRYFDWLLQHLPANTFAARWRSQRADIPEVATLGRQKIGGVEIGTERFLAAFGLWHVLEH